MISSTNPFSTIYNYNVQPLAGSPPQEQSGEPITAEDQLNELNMLIKRLSKNIDTVVCKGHIPTQMKELVPEFANIMIKLEALKSFKLTDESQEKLSDNLDVFNDLVNVLSQLGLKDIIDEFTKKAGEAITKPINPEERCF